MSKGGAGIRVALCLTYYKGEIMAAKPLNTKEKKWLERLEKVLMSCPTERLECYTIGDSDLTFYDKNVLLAHEANNDNKEDQDISPACEDCGAHLGVVLSNFWIVGAAG